MTPQRHQLPGDLHGGYEEFVVAVGPRLRRALVARYGPHDGPDATAEALAYAFEHWDRVALMANPAGYLYRVGQSRYQGWWRRGRPRGLPPVPAELPRVEPGLPTALGSLSERQRVAVLLVHAYGYTHDEAAEVLGVSVSTLRNHLLRGLDRLRRHLGGATP